MKVFNEIEPCRSAVRESQRAGNTVGLVPTMGALHKGHLSLVRAARERCARVAVSIFVNPTQFGPGEDFDAYPRTLDADLAVCESEDVDIVFTPTVKTMYPADSLTSVHVNRVTDVLCGSRRPGHFDGVAGVVAKLFHIIPANAAFFGEKDYQQLVVIERMVHDLNMAIEIVACPTVREPDGLAVSSRNTYLSADHRKQATSLSRALFDAVERVTEGERDAATVVAAIRDDIRAAGPADIEYIDVVDARSLQVQETIAGSARICLAVRIGPCRLIDNVAVDVAQLGG